MTIPTILHSFAIENRLQVLGTHHTEESQKDTEQHQIAGADNRRDDSTARFRHDTVVEEKTRNERQQRHQQRGAFDVVQNVKLLAEGSTEHLQVQCHREDKDREDLLQIGPELVGEDNHSREQRLPQHDHRFPEAVRSLVGSVHETGHVVDPSLLVVVLDLSEDRRRRGDGKSDGEGDEEWPSDGRRQEGVGSLVAVDAGVHSPVIRRPFVEEIVGGVHLDAVQYIRQRLAEGDVADVEDGDGAQRRSFGEERNVFALSHLRDRPDEHEDDDGGQR